MAKIDDRYELSSCGRFYQMKPEIAERYRQTVDEQLRLWLQGTSVHNVEFDECCPDFSCCLPDMLWSEPMRLAFANADSSSRFHMLSHGLSSLARKSGVNVAIATDLLIGEEKH